MKIGSTDITDVKIGATDINEVRIGNDLIWQRVSSGYILDDYPNAAAAYSVRKLSSTYSGFSIRARRDTDNLEQNFVFVNDVIDKTQLENFSNGGNVYIVTWFDQSGNGYNAIRPEVSQQPQIVGAGVLITVNNKPCIQTNGEGGSVNSRSMYVEFPSEISQPTSVFLTASMRTNTNESRFIYGSSDDLGVPQLRMDLLDRASEKWAYFAGTSSVESSVSTDTNQHIWTNVFNDAASNMHLDGTLIASGSSGTSGTKGFTIGGLFKDSPQTSSAAANYQEFIFYPTDQSVNRVGIETNINDYYAIYLTTAEVDAFLINAVGQIGGVIDLSSDQPRSSASDAAVAQLTSDNVTVITR